MGIQTKLLILIGVFLAGNISGGYAMHKWYQAEMKAQQDKVITEHNEAILAKDKKYAKLAKLKQKVKIRTRVVERKIFAASLDACGRTPAGVRLRNEYAEETNKLLTSGSDGDVSENSDTGS